jgi:hypothetical protein
MKQFVLIIAIILCIPVVQAQNTEVYRIEVGRDRSYDNYSNQELRRRVWQLERAVQQLQQKVFQLEMKPTEIVLPVQKNEWTCRISSFGKTHISTARTKAKAMADVIQKCSSATSAVHCDEDEVSCGNE